MKSTYGRSTLVLSLVLAGPLGCSDDDAANDGGDVSADSPDDGSDGDGGPVIDDFAVGSGPASATVRGNPFDLEVELADGSRWTAADSADAALALIAFGVVERTNPNRYYDPAEPMPQEWVRPGPVRSAVETTGGWRLDVEIPASVGGSLQVDLWRHCAADAASRCRFSVRARVVDPAFIVFTRLSWALDAGEGLYGLGERFDHPEATGRRHELQMAIADSEASLNELHVPVPWVVSTRGYAVRVLDDRSGLADLGATDPGIATFTFGSGPTSTPDLAFDVFTAPDPWTLAAGVHEGAGLDDPPAFPRLPPDWAFGPQLWRNVLEDRDELLADAAAIRAHDLPVSVLWIDNPWQTAYNDLTFNPLQFPEAEEMIDRLHDAGYRVLVWNTPYLDNSDDSDVREGMAHDTGGLFEEARDAGYFVRNSGGTPMIYPWNSGHSGGTLDFTNPEASEWWTGVVRRATGLGIDGFKLDYGEMITNIAGSRLGWRWANGLSENEMHNRFSVGYHLAYRAALDRDRPEGFVIGRASALGGGAAVDCLWPGDLDSDFSDPGDPRPDGERAVGGLPAAVHALQSLAVSGFPCFGSDTGGFRNGAPTGEVLVGWAAHTAFSPVMQIGGGGDSHNPWDATLYPEPGVLEDMRRLMRVHQQLVPFFRTLACDAAGAGTPPALPVGLAWPDDPAARAEDCAYLLGGRLLVAPACRGENPRNVHLPAGTWVSWTTGETLTGPTDVAVADPARAVPVFLAAGAVIPLFPDDLDTMLPATDPATITPENSTRVAGWSVVPPAEGDSAGGRFPGPGTCAADGPGAAALTVTTDGDCLRFAATGDPGFAAAVTVRWSGFSSAPPATVAGATPAASRDDVLAGCDGCWFLDGERGELLVSPVPDSICR